MLEFGVTLQLLFVVGGGLLNQIALYVKKCSKNVSTPLPEDSELYYGFTKFAMSLNEMENGQAELLPPSDTRFRPDQRLLEQGDITAAEDVKAALEARQRERRRQNEMEGRLHIPRWFRYSHG
ncbi:hypothetical protein J437_LFUL009134 [Ladona fulva]|uniref:Uncharacterized protein n=1 Tax=Ladona fulva TaxID=123851 RepID=A0A8K0K960_LADFU|nr:hypothetical protein J437_LFUL009134 [Ladona fulva]